jgi:predicted RNA-binding Zn-ribbon protein involved in translation (DUF1610 family)
MSPGVPISVAELHRRLLPYAVCRERLGYASKAEYDIGMLELISDRQILHVPEKALIEAAKVELDSPEPGLAFLQRFAASEVRLRELESLDSGMTVEVGNVDTEDAPPDPATPADAPFALADEGAEPGHVETGPPVATLETGKSRTDYVPGLDDPLFVPIDEAADALGIVEPFPKPGDSGDVEVDGEPMGSIAADGTPCRSCGAGLPLRDGVRYCPACGADQLKWPCPACGKEVEQGWSYCALCGKLLPTR